MKKIYSRYHLILLSLIISFIQSTTECYASHAQSADITYECLGGNQYRINLSFYRDCAGVAAPGNVTVNLSSASCNQNFNTTLFPIAGTGQDVTPICNTMTTVCTGGTYPGVQEWLYTGIVTLPMACTDWVFSFTLCCRNNAINTINNPGNENIYVEANLNNLNFPCNNSPSFSNPPIPFVCVNQTYCFNHGATDADGDSLVYYLVPPATGPNTTVTYLAGWSALQPVSSSPALTLNPATGDICMTPTALEVTVMAVRVEEWRNGVLVGSVIRDIQLRVITCTNDVPALGGINNTGSYTATACAGSNLSFFVASADDDAGQTLTVTWNNAIAGASFTTNGAQQPVATFSWTPTAAQVSNTPYCFTVTVTDDNCPLNGTQTYSFCITVSGFAVTTSTTNSNCGASNGTATAFPNGGNAPYSYAWTSGGNSQTANGLQAGTYAVVVTDDDGCSVTANAVVAPGSAPGNINMSEVPVSCYGGNNGQAIASVNGGQGPYTYNWSNGGSTATLIGLTAGYYSVVVTTADGCTSTSDITVTQPASPLVVAASKNDISCYGAGDGSAMVLANGGTTPYTYAWTNGNTTAIANGLNAGTHAVSVNDANGCSANAAVNIIEPTFIQVSITNQDNVSCNGGSNGSASVAVNGGTPGYTITWNTNPVQTGITAMNMTAGAYNVNVTDANNCNVNYVITITEPAAVAINITNISPITCYSYNNGSATAAATGGTGGYNFSWNTNPAQLSFTASNMQPGNYIVTVADANNCTDTAQVTIVEPDPVGLIVPNADTICPGDNVTLYAYASGGTGNYSYNWNNGLGNINSHVVSPPATTVYTVQVTDANGCPSQSLSIPLYVNDINSLTLSISPAQSVCEGNPVSIYANLNGGLGTYIYTWNNGLGAGTGPFNFVPATSTTYTVTVTDNCNNSLSGNIPVMVNPLPVASLIPVSATDCGKVQLVFSNNSGIQNGDTYFWDFGDGGFSTEVNPTHVFNNSGTFNIQLTVTSAAGCNTTVNTTAVIVVNPQADAFFDASTHEAGEFTPNISFYNYSSYATNYQWTFGTVGTSTLENPNFTFPESGTYTVQLIASNQFGCTDTAYLDILINPEHTLYVPNAFTPDGDGLNDFFFAKGQHIKEFEMMIFNRWGELIFQSAHMDNAWDGTHKGEKVKDGVYVYKIVYKNNIDEKKEIDGSVTLLK